MEILIGTEKSITLSSHQNEGYVSLTCFVGENNGYFVEASTTENPTTGCACPMSDPMESTTAFVQDNLYNDMTRYQQTTSGKNEFSRTFPDANLSGNEIVAASTAFHLNGLGHTSIILIHPSEHGLLNFAKQREWKYILLK